jgi:hypothetical protein
MTSAARIFLMLLGAGCLLPAQAVNDLNSLVLEAGRFAAHNQTGQPAPNRLALFRIVGDGGGSQEALTLGTDIQRWTLIYQVQPAQDGVSRPRLGTPWGSTRGDEAGARQPSGPPSSLSAWPSPPMPDQPRSAVVTCDHGMFTTLVWSPLPVFDCKSLEWVWITISLDDAVARLDRLGFTHGFSSLTIERPLHPQLSDECTYIFRCDADHAYVGISGQTGSFLWKEELGTEPWPE